MSPEVIPNPPGASYGLYEKYFFYSDDSEDEEDDEEVDQEQTHHGGNEDVEMTDITPSPLVRAPAAPTTITPAPVTPTPNRKSNPVLTLPNSA